MRALVLILAWAFVLAAPAYAERRVALVIGNDAYEHLPPLQKAVNDARAVGAALEKIGFTVIRGENLTQRGMQDRLFDLTERLSPGDTAFLFYAGHGVALGGGNHLLPIDTPVPQGKQAEERVRLAGLAEAEIIAQVKEAGAQLTVVVLDACRDNPFRQAGLRDIGGTRGLLRPPEAKGVFSIYSAGFGETARERLGKDDPNPNSLFTRVLAPALTEPGLSLVEVAYKVNEEVAALASSVDHEQNPAHYDQARGLGVYLAGAPPAMDACAAAKAHYDEAKAIGTRDAYRAFAEAYTDCPPYIGFAESQIAKLDAAGAQGEGKAVVDPPPDEEREIAVIPEETTVPDGSAASTAADCAAESAARADMSKEFQEFFDRFSPCAPATSAPEAGDAASGGTDGASGRRVAMSPGADYFGGDYEVLRDTTVAGCEAACIADRRCQAFSFNEGARWCFLKESVGELRSVAGAVSGRIVQADASDPGDDDATADLGDWLLTAPPYSWTAVFSAAIAPDDRRVVLGANDGTLGIWDFNETGGFRLLAGHSGETPDPTHQLVGDWRPSVVAVSYAPDGSWFATGSETGAIGVWDNATLERRRLIPCGCSRISRVLVSPDGASIVAAGWNGKVRVFDAASGKLLRDLPSERYVGEMVWSPDGKAVIYGPGDFVTRMTDWRTGKVLKEEPLPRVEWPEPVAYDVAVYRMAESLAKEQSDAAIRIAEGISVASQTSESGHSLRVGTFPAAVWTFPSGLVEYTTSLHHVLNHALEAGADPSPNAAAIAADGRLVVASYSSGLTTLARLEPGLLYPITRPPAPTLLASLFFNRDGHLVVRADGTYFATPEIEALLQVRKGEETRPVPPEYRAAFFRAGSALASRDAPRAAQP